MIEDTAPLWRRMDRRWIAGLLIVVAIIAIVAWRIIEAREGGAGVAPATPPPRVSIVDGATVTTIDADDQKRSGIASTALASASGVSTATAYATVVDLTPLSDLGNAAAAGQAQLAAATARASASRAAFERARALHADDQNISLAQLQAAEASYRADQAAQTAAQAQAETAMASARQQFGPVLGGSLRSPLVRSLLERGSVLLQVTAASEMSFLRPAPVISVQPAGGTALQAHLVSSATRTDPRIQGASFYYVAPAAPGLLAGMNLAATMPTGGSISGVAVPASAVIVWQGQSWAYQRIDRNRFKRIPISTAVPAPGGGYLAPGLAPGTQLVTSGAQMLLSEELRPPPQSAAAGDGDD
jgi:hypothetical protein